MKFELTFTWTAFIVFFIKYNNWFGWNWTAKSTDELICDGISLLMLSLALHLTGNTIKQK